MNGLIIALPIKTAQLNILNRKLYAQTERHNMTDKEKEPEKYQSGSSDGYGYVLQWRLKPESEALADIFSKMGDPGKVWSNAPYSIEDLGIIGEISKVLVRPMIKKYDADLSKYGLVRRDIAVAIHACLLTSTPSKLLKHVEWRISRLKIKTSHNIVYDNDGHDTEARSDMFREAMEI